MWRYRFCGLDVESDQPLRGFESSLVGENGGDVVALRWVERDQLGPAPTAFKTRQGGGDASPTLVVTKDTSHYVFTYDDGTIFRIDAQEHSVQAAIAPNQSQEDALTYFLGPILGFVLRLKERVTLHASAVLLAHGAVAFLGAAGAGKSSTAAQLNHDGLPVISDDLLRIEIDNGEAWCYSSYPRVRLWEDSVDRIFGQPDALPLLTPNWSKRYLPLGSPGHPFAPGRHRLHSLVLLHDDDITKNGSPILPLLQNVYASDLCERAHVDRQFRVVGELARRLPVYSIPRDQITVERLQALCSVPTTGLNTEPA